MSFGEKLTTLRKQKGLSQEELGEKLNVTRQTISKWELDQTVPDMNKLTDIAKYFEVNVNELTNEEEIIQTNETINNNENSKKSTGTVVIVIILIIILVATISYLTWLVMIGSLAKKLFNRGNEIQKSAVQIINNIQEHGQDEIYNQIKKEQGEKNYYSIINEARELTKDEIQYTR